MNSKGKWASSWLMNPHWCVEFNYTKLPSCFLPALHKMPPCGCCKFQSRKISVQIPPPQNLNDCSAVRNTSEGRLCLRVSQISTCQSGDFIFGAYHTQAHLQASFLSTVCCSYRCCAYRGRCRVNKSLLNHACPTDGISVDLGVFAHVWPPLPPLNVECLLCGEQEETRGRQGGAQGESWDFKWWCGCWQS